MSKSKALFNANANIQAMYVVGAGVHRLGSMISRTECGKLIRKRVDGCLNRKRFVL
jgi:hypothetical protein